jgi:hypothetical protein
MKMIRRKVVKDLTADDLLEIEDSHQAKSVRIVSCTKRTQVEKYHIAQIRSERLFLVLGKEGLVYDPEAVVQWENGDTPLATTEVRNVFQEHWNGSDEDLDKALEVFYADVRDSTRQALLRNTEYVSEVLNEVDDYIMNHYF